MDVNKVILIGRLTKNCESGYTTSGFCIAKFTIAVNEMKDKNGNVPVNYFDVKLFGKQAEALSRYLQKGKQIAVVGSLKQERWEKDGQKFSRVCISADNVQLIGGMKTGSNDQQTDWGNGQGQSYDGNGVPF